MSDSTTSTLYVQVINDSGLPDASVYLLLTGQSGIVGSGITFLDLSKNPSGITTGGALNALSSVGYFMSPYTGNTLPIYEFTVSSLDSGRLIASYNTPISFSGATGPSSTNSPIRWDKMEFAYAGPTSGAADLTSLDFFGIPMQLDYLDGSGNVISSASFYTSTPTLLNTLYGLDKKTMANAFQKVSNGSPVFGWNPSTDSLSTFLRVVGPQTLTAGDNPPTPYPSFSAYLSVLCASNQSFTITGSAGVGAPAPPNNNVTYNYTGSFSTDGKGNYQLTLTGTTSGKPYGLYTDSEGDTTDAQLPASLPVTLDLSASDLDNTIYSAAATSFTVGQSTDPNAPNYIAPDSVKYTKNSAYATVAGDIIAGLNFGYPGGVFGNTSSDWYSNPPTPFPFGAARSSNDGLYNPYAAVLYNQSDSYGFPFSDRGGRPSPLLPQPSNAATLRITILNDQRMDAPQVTITQRNDWTFTLDWDPINLPAGATLTGYELDITPPYSPWILEVPANTTTTTVGGLPEGTLYTFKLTALGTASNGNPIRSHSTVVSGVTSGKAPALDGDFKFLTTLNWSAQIPPPVGTTYTIGGVSYTPGQPPAQINGAAGVNVFPLIIKNGKQTLYQGNYVVSLEADGSGYNLTPNGDFMLDGNETPLVIAGGTPPYTSAPGNQLVIGTAFAPVATKEACAVVFPRKEIYDLDMDSRPTAGV